MGILKLRDIHTDKIILINLTSIDFVFEISEGRSEIVIGVHSFTVDLDILDLKDMMTSDIDSDPNSIHEIPYLGMN